MSYIVETFNLTKRYPQIKRYHEIITRPLHKREITALENINIRVKKGEVFGLLGPNGAGKTTLIKTLCTLLLPNEGTAVVNGYDILKEEKEVKRSIGYVVNDERSFYWRLTGRQNLGFFAILNNLASNRANQRIDEVLRLVGLETNGDKRVKDYSTGMKQKLAIARGMLSNPEVLFMDEPTRSLDPVIAKSLREFIRKNIVDGQGKTVFLSTHNLSEAEDLCDTIAIIDKGKIKACGTLDEMRAHFDGKRRYLIELENPTPGLMKGLKDVFPFELRETYPGGGVTIEVADDDRWTVSRAIETIVNHGGKVVRCSPEGRTLEEVFSRVTSHRDSEEGHEGEQG
ncbi:MAG: ABC transporter ATP-binding protein [Syntrophobacterales bacterium]|nr:MAG: ABC transporter ATP-binding protein [Syntrophobacterales bacterium]